MNFYRIPMTAHVVPTPDQIALFLSIVTDPIQLPVYVHCRAGKHWTGVMTAIYRMETNGWNADQAFEEMKRYRTDGTSCTRNSSSSSTSIGRSV